MNKIFYILLFILILLLILFFSMVNDIFGASAFYKFEAYPTNAPIETCFNGGLTTKDGCGKVYLPMVLQ